MNSSDELIAYEAELWASTLEALGNRTIEVLREIAADFPSFKPLSAQVIHFVEPCPMVDLLRRVETKTDGVVVTEHRDGTGRLFIKARHRAWLASGLVVRLPPDALPRGLIDRRMQSDVGL